jgi:hypothetical protein
MEFSFEFSFTSTLYIYALINGQSNQIKWFFHCTSKLVTSTGIGELGAGCNLHTTHNSTNFGMHAKRYRYSYLMYLQLLSASYFLLLVESGPHVVSRLVAIPHTTLSWICCH